MVLPLSMDLHEDLPQGTTAKDVADYHAKDVSSHGEYGVKYLRFWIDEGAGRVFCLIEAPNAQIAMRFHREGQGGYETWSHPPGAGRSLKLLNSCRATAAVLPTATVRPMRVGRNDSASSAGKVDDLRFL